MDRQKAWFVYIPDEWGELVHAETRGKAKAFIMHEFGVEQYIDLQATRVKGLDGVPITCENAHKANFHYYDEDGLLLTPDEFPKTCKCEVCNEDKKTHAKNH